MANLKRVKNFKLFNLEKPFVKKVFLKKENLRHSNFWAMEIWNIKLKASKLKIKIPSFQNTKYFNFEIF